MAAVPSSADTIANLPVRDTVTCRNHMSDDFMTGYNWTKIIINLAPSTQAAPLE
jgi:hypothetical protein